MNETSISTGTSGGSGETDGAHAHEPVDAGAADCSDEGPGHETGAAGYPGVLPYGLRDREGWVYLSSAGPDARILFIENHMSSSPLSVLPWCKHLTVCCSLVGELPAAYRRAMEQFKDKLHFVEHRGSRLPFDDDEFDVVIFNELGGSYYARYTSQQTDSLTTSEPMRHVDDVLAAELARVLAPEGRLAILAGNKLSYQRIRDRLIGAVDVAKSTLRSRANPSSERLPELSDVLWPKRQIVIGTLVRSLARVGLHQVRLFGLISDGDETVEVIPQTGYQSIKNISSRGEHLRLAILSRRLWRWFAPAFYVSVSKGNGRPTILTRLTEHLFEHGWFDSTHADEIRCLNYQILRGKVIVVLGRRLDAPDSRVVVLPQDEQALEQRHLEAGRLRKLKKLPEDIARLIPEPLATGSFEGHPYFLMPQLPGVSFDLPSRNTELLTRRSLDFLIRLQDATLQLKPDSDLAMMARIDDYVRFLIGEAPDHGQRLKDLNARVQNTVRGKSWPTVCFHGDFKLENLIFRRKSLELSGVIDWELSDPEGPPLLDVFYLLLYNRVIHTDVHSAHVMARLAAEGFTSRESDYVRQVMTRAGLTDDQVPPLFGLFFLHHFARRLTYDDGLLNTNQAFANSLAAVESLFEEPAGRVLRQHHTAAAARR